MKRIFSLPKWQQAFLVLGLVLPFALLWAMVSMRSWQPRVLPERGTFTDLAFSPTEPFLACGSLAAQSVGNQLQMWDSRTRQLKWSRAQEAYRVVFSPDGKWLASATPKRLFVKVSKSFFSMGSKSLFPARLKYLFPSTVAESGHIMLWEVQSGRKLWEIPVAHDFRRVDENLLEFSADGRKLLVRTDNLTLARIDVATGKPLAPLKLAPLWDFPVLRPLKSYPTKGRYRRACFVALAPGADTILVSMDIFGADEPHRGISKRAHKRELWVCDGRGHFRFQLKGAFQGVSALSTGGRRLMCYNMNGAGVGSVQLQVWDVQAHRLIRTLSAPAGATFDGIKNVAFSRDGQHVFVSFTTGSSGAINAPVTVIIWDLKTGKMIRTLASNRIQGGMGSIVSLSSDEATVAVTESFQSNGAVQLWRVK